MKILFASSEAHPLIKTGGLADVSASLPRALKSQHHDVRLVIPAYKSVLAHAGKTKRIASLTFAGASGPVHILETRLPGTTVKTYLIESSDHFDRPGAPYTGPDGRDWPDNAQRFTLFSRAAAALALDTSILKWPVDVVHCNDWQTGLVPALLTLAPQRPATVFTIHNLAYQGTFDWNTFQSLGLPQEWWSHHALEFHDKMSFIKGGLAFADQLTTVSPTYAREIRTPEFGCGLEGLLEHRSRQLTGILNGADYNVWNPGKDALLPHSYHSRNLSGKAANKSALQKKFRLPQSAETPLLAHVGRLVEQKGIDLLLNQLPALAKKSVQLIILGTGEPALEKALTKAARKYPKNISVKIGYDEPLAHLLEAGADAFLMPSRYEPCGLNQIYSLRYGTPPIVRRTGGLADTVVDSDKANLSAGTATGFQFDESSATALMSAIDRMLAVYRQPAQWKKLMRTGMRQDFSWNASAKQYLALYEQAIAGRAPRRAVSVLG